MQALAQYVQRIVEQIDPTVLLCVGTGPAAWRLTTRAAWRASTSVADVPLGEVADLALVDSGCALEGSDAAQLLARLRDLAARRVLVIVRAAAGSAWSRRALISYGYLYRDVARDGDEVVQLFEFDIGHYKHTPDWLGPQYWANPERWDKDRW